MIVRIKNSLNKSALLKDTLVTSILGFFGRISGFLIPVLIAKWFGITNQTDVFFLAYTIIVYLTLIFSEVVRSIIVPYISEMEVRDKEKISFFIGNIVVFILVFLSIISIFFVCISKPLLGIITGLPNESLDLLAKLIIWISPLIVIVSLTSVAIGILNAYKHFWAPAISPLFRTVTAIIVIYLFKEKYGILSLVFGYLGGEIFHLLALGVLYKINKMPSIKFSKSHFFDFSFLKFLKHSSYQIIGMTTVGLIPFIDKSFASWLGKGSISVLEYSQRLYMVPYIFLSSGIMVTLLTHWSDLYYKKQFKIFYGSYLKVKKALFVVCVLSIVFFILASKNIVNVIYGNSYINNDNLNIISYLFSILILSLLPEIIGLIMTRIFIITKNTQVIRDLGILRISIKIFFNLILIKYFGILGIVFATLLMYIISFVFLDFKLKNILSSIVDIREPVIYDENFNS